MFNMVDQLLALGEKSQVATRKCSICNNYKSLDSFTIKDKSKGYLDTRCKPCKSESVSALTKRRKKCLKQLN